MKPEIKKNTSTSIFLAIHISDRNIWNQFNFCLASPDALEVIVVTHLLTYWSIALTWLMWPWWVMIPIEDSKLIKVIGWLYFFFNSLLTAIKGSPSEFGLFAIGRALSSPPTHYQVLIQKIKISKLQKVHWWRFHRRLSLSWIHFHFLACCPKILAPGHK